MEFAELVVLVLLFGVLACQPGTVWDALLQMLMNSIRVNLVCNSAEHKFHVKAARSPLTVKEFIYHSLGVKPED